MCDALKPLGKKKKKSILNHKGDKNTIKIHKKI